MKKTIFTAGISIFIGFILAVGISNYIIPLFWDRRLIVKLGILTTETIFFGIIAYLIIAWNQGNRSGVFKLAENLGEVIKKNSNLFILLYTALVGIAAFALLCWITKDGSGVSPDSTIYMDTAKSLLKGEGFYALGAPLTHFPPLYPIFLALANLLDHNIIQAATLLNAILFAINIGLAGWAVFLASRNFLAVTGTIFFLLSSSAFLNLHLIALSEPLFITFILLSFILFTMYSVKPTLALLVSSSAFLGLAMITRYAGVFFLPPVILIILFVVIQRRVAQRIRHALIYLVLACIPIAIWLIRNMLIAKTGADRVIVFHPMPIFKLENFFISTYDFIFPMAIPSWIKLVTIGMLFAFLIVLIVIFLKKRIFREINRQSMNVLMPLSCGLFSIFYLLGLIISLLFFDAYIDVDARILSPVFILMSIGAFSVMWALSKKLNKPIVWWTFLFFVVLSISINTNVTIKTAIAFRKNNYGFNTYSWRESDTLAYVNSLSRDLIIYSNGSDAIGLLIEKVTLPFPLKFEPTSQVINQNYDQEISAMCKDIKQNKALVVFFKQITWRTYFPTQKELASGCQLSVIKRLADGTVLGTK